MKIKFTTTDPMARRSRYLGGSIAARSWARYYGAWSSAHIRAGHPEEAAKHARTAAHEARKARRYAQALNRYKAATAQEAAQ